MPHQVYCFDSAEDYVSGSKEGAFPVTSKLDTWEEAEQFRELFRKHDKSKYYNIVHFTQCDIYTVESTRDKPGSEKKGE